MSNAPNNQTLVTTTKTENGKKETLSVVTDPQDIEALKATISGWYPSSGTTSHTIAYDVTRPKKINWFTITTTEHSQPRTLRYKNPVIKNLNVWEGEKVGFDPDSFPVTFTYENGARDRDDVAWETITTTSPSGAVDCGAQLVPLPSNSGYVSAGAPANVGAYAPKSGPGNYNSTIYLRASFDVEWERDSSSNVSGPNYPWPESTEMKFVPNAANSLGDFPVYQGGTWVEKTAAELGFPATLTESNTTSSIVAQDIIIETWTKKDVFEGSCIACCCTCTGEGYPQITACPPGQTLTGITFPQYANCSAANGLAVWNVQTTCMYCVYT